MTNFASLYSVASASNELPTHGPRNLLFHILVGNGDRQWLEVHYFDRSIRQLGGVTSIIPAHPDDPLSLLDACIAFFPQHFRDCPSLRACEKQLRGTAQLNFARGGNAPKQWEQLRHEAGEAFMQLAIYQAGYQLALHTDTPVERPGFSLRGVARLAKHLFGAAAT